MRGTEDWAYLLFLQKNKIWSATAWKGHPLRTLISFLVVQESGSAIQNVFLVMFMKMNVWLISLFSSVSSFFIICFQWAMLLAREIWKKTSFKYQLLTEGHCIAHLSFLILIESINLWLYGKIFCCFYVPYLCGRWSVISYLASCFKCVR